MEIAIDYRQAFICVPMGKEAVYWKTRLPSQDHVIYLEIYQGLKVNIEHLQPSYNNNILFFRLL